jgi:hypothetical protein
MAPIRSVVLSAATLLLLVPAVYGQAATASPPLGEGSSAAGEQAGASAAVLLAPGAGAIIPTPEPLSALRLNPMDGGEAPVPLFQDRGDRRSAFALVGAGAALVVGGAIVGDDAGTILMVTGVVLGAIGVYRML